MIAISPRTKEAAEHRLLACLENGHRLLPVRAIDVVYRLPLPADPNDHTGAALIRNRFTMHHVSGDMDEIPSVQLDDFGAALPKLDGHGTFGDVCIGGVVTVMVPSSRRTSREGRKPRPNAVMRESLAPLHSSALLGRRILKFFLDDHFWSVHVLKHERRAGQASGNSSTFMGGQTPTTAFVGNVSVIPHHRHTLSPHPPAAITPKTYASQMHH